MRIRFLPVLVFLLSGSASAGEADVIDVKVHQTSENIFRFDVTVKHDDEGWQHYADHWDISGPDGTIYGTRTLYHPHVNEQPFTRSLSGVKIPAGVRTVTLRARDSRHQFGGKTLSLTLQRH